MFHTFTPLVAQTTTPTNNKIDLAGQWDTIWKNIQSSTGFSKLQTVLDIIGVLIILAAILRWLWSRRTGGGADHKHVGWTLLVGAVLMAPDLLIPALLTIADAFVNAIVGLFGG